MATKAIATARTPVYYGPSSSLYASVGAIGAQEEVDVLARENGYYHIVYSTSTKPKSGYVPVGSFANESALPTSRDFVSGKICIANSFTKVYFGPSSSGYQEVGSLDAGETVTAFIESSADSFTLIEYGTSVGTKRGYAETKFLTPIAGRLALLTANTPVFSGPATSYTGGSTIYSSEYAIVLGVGQENGNTWYFVEYTSGSSRKRGYISTTNISFIGSGTMPYPVALSNTVGSMTSSQRVYAGPSTKYVDIGSVDNGEVVYLLNAETILGEAYRQIEYSTPSGQKRGYVSNSAISATTSTFPHSMKSDATVYSVYGGPSNQTYASIGSLAPNEAIRCINKEGDFFCVEYVAGDKLKRGYVQKSDVVNYTSINNTISEQALFGYMDHACDGTYTIYSGPDANKYASVGTLYPAESVTVIGDESDTYTFIEYTTPSGTKRGYLSSIYLSGACLGMLAKNTNVATLPVYLGPGTLDYDYLGSVYPNEYFVALDYLDGYDKDDASRELHSQKWYYIEFNRLGKRCRGYVDETYVSLLTIPGFPNAIMNERRGNGIYRAMENIEVFAGPSSLHESIGTIYSGEQVSSFEPRAYEGHFINIEYLNKSTNKFKRGYVSHTLLEPVQMSIPSPTLSVTNMLAARQTYGESYMKNDLAYYKMGHGTNALIAVFAIHGYEDAWAADGLELVKIANHLIETMVSRKNEAWANTWTLYVIPTANPDGILHGYTHCGPGRANVEDEVDMNRCFPVGFEEITNRRRNRTGETPLIPEEASSLQTLITNIAQTHTIHLLDVHGWLNCYYGDAVLGQHFTNAFNTFGLYASTSPGKGFLFKYAQSLQTNAKAALIELPFPDNAEAIVTNQYAAKVTTAVRNILGDIE